MRKKDLRRHASDTAGHRRQSRRILGSGPVNIPKKLSFYDTVFHLELAHASNNQLLDNVMHTIMGSYTSSFYRLFDEHEDLRTHAIEFHRRILHAVREQDVAAARQAMKEHINDVINYSNPAFLGSGRMAEITTGRLFRT